MTTKIDGVEYQIQANAPDPYKLDVPIQVTMIHRKDSLVTVTYYNYIFAQYYTEEFTIERFQAEADEIEKLT